MGLPAVLDVAIGLIFIFLILSLLASELQELLTTLLQWRAKHLRDSIEVLLAGGVGTQQDEAVRLLVNRLYDDPLIRNINQEAKGLAGKVRTVTRILNQKGSFGTNQSSGPSYIAPDTFATSLLEQIGLASLSRKLVEVRLEKFATRIVGVYEGGQRQNQPVVIPSNTSDRFNQKLWNKGRIRLIAEKVGLKDANGNLQDLKDDPNFQILVEEFDDILHDFETQESSLNTSVERMGESLNHYINSYLSTSTNNSDEITKIKTTFAKRLETFKAGIFGTNNERAVASGGLRPTLLEIAELLDQTSTTYKEVNDAYYTLLIDGRRLDQDMVPLLAAQLLEKYVAIAEQQLTSQFPYQMARIFQQRHPVIFNRFEQKWQKLCQKIGDMPKVADQSDSVNSARFVHWPQLSRQFSRRNPNFFERLRNRLVYQWQQMLSVTPDELRRKRQRMMSNMFEWISIDESRALLITLLYQETAVIEPIATPINNSDPADQAGHIHVGALSTFVDGALERLRHEDRQLLIDAALSQLSRQKEWDEPTDKKQRSLYANYQTYKTIKQVLDRLPISVKESFTILARRAQTQVKKAENDVNQFREEVAMWFDRSMSRASGVYKRNTKGVIILIGVFLAILANVDSGFVANRLSNDESLRQAVIEKASSVTPAEHELQKTAQEKLEAVRNDAKEALEELALPIGFTPENFSQQLDCPLTANQEPPSDWDSFYQQCLPPHSKPLANATTKPSESQLSKFFVAIGTAFNHPFTLLTHYPNQLLRIFLGWLLTGLAISMGAPFWFDLLSKVINVRNTGGKPASPEGSSTTTSSSNQNIS